MTDENAPRPGSASDLSLRMNRMEQRQDNIEQEVRTLSATVARVEQNQTHATELNKLRFDALDMGIKSLGGQLADFIKRIEAIIDGEIDTVQAKQGREIVANYLEWKKGVDEDRESLRVLDARLSLLGRLAVLLVSSNIVAWIVALVAALN